jgi:hypothetical protein
LFDLILVLTLRDARIYGTHVRKKTTLARLFSPPRRRFARRLCRATRVFSSSLVAASFAPLRTTTLPLLPRNLDSSRIESLRVLHHHHPKSERGGKKNKEEEEQESAKGEMIGGREPARARARSGQCAAPVVVVPSRLRLAAPSPRPQKRREDLVATARTPSSSSSSFDERPSTSRLNPPRASTSATADAPSTPDNNESLVINADAIPPTNALRVNGVLSPFHPPPGPWAPPLLAETDHAPDEFLKVTTLRPGPIWYPAWMRYRRRDGNDIFWSDKLSRNTLDVPRFERRWTVFSTVWYLCNWWRFRGFPPTFRYLIASAYRMARWRLYEGHKRLVLWQAKLEAALAARAVEKRRKRAAEAEAAAGAGTGGSTSSTSNPYGPRPGASFSRLMALRRLHWQNSPVAELLYLQNVFLTGRVHQLPPRMLRRSPPTLFWLF